MRKADGVSPQVLLLALADFFFGKKSCQGSFMSPISFPDLPCARPRHMDRFIFLRRTILKREFYIYFLSVNDYDIHVQEDRHHGRR